MRPREAGFTLIELIVVIVIIGILASIAAPMMHKLKVKAICSEAVTTMGVIRNALRMYYSEHGAWPATWAWETHPGEPDWSWMGSDANQLTGTYFGKESFCIQVPEAMISIECYPAPPFTAFQDPTPPRWTEARDIIDPGATTGCLVMTVADGRVYQRNITDSGYDPWGTSEDRPED